MVKKEEDVFEQLKDIFSETGKDYNPTDEEILNDLKDPHLGENMNPEKIVLFVTKLHTRMNESKKFKNQAEEIVKERTGKKPK